MTEISAINEVWAKAQTIKKTESVVKYPLWKRSNEGKMLLSHKTNVVVWQKWLSFIEVGNLPKKEICTHLCK